MQLDGNLPRTWIGFDLFIFGCAVSHCCLRTFLQLRRTGTTALQCSAYHCGGFSCYGELALGHVDFSSCGCGAASWESWALEPVVPTVVTHGLSFSMAPGIFLHQGLNLCPHHCQADSLPESPGKPLDKYFSVLALYQPPGTGTDLWTGLST